MRGNIAAKPLKRNNVALAIIQQTFTLGLGKRPAADGDVPHLVLFGGANAVEFEIRQRADQASTGRCREAIGAVAKLDEEVENVGWLRPAQAFEATQLGTGVKRDKQVVRADRERW